jgi:hypothetical protein
MEGEPVLPYRYLTAGQPPPPPTGTRIRDRLVGTTPDQLMGAKNVSAHTTIHIPCGMGTGTRFNTHKSFPGWVGGTKNKPGVVPCPDPRRGGPGQQHRPPASHQSPTDVFFILQSLLPICVLAPVVLQSLLPTDVLCLFCWYVSLNFLQSLLLTLLEKMAHFSLLITHGTGRSSQWTISFVIFSSSCEEKLSVISIRSSPSVAKGSTLRPQYSKGTLKKLKK